MKYTKETPLKVLELFAGIGACSSALTRLGIEYEIVDAVEIDKFAIKSFNAIHGTSFEPQDITKYDKDVEVDLIMHGSPCVDYSIAGKQRGGDIGSGTRSSLMWETVRIVSQLKPKYIIWENVKNLLSKKHFHNFSAYLETMKQLGYKSYYQVLNAKDYGIPQNRERVFTISIRNDIDTDFIFPEKQPLKLKLKDMLEDNVDEKYFLKSVQLERMKKTNYESAKFENRVRNEDSIAPTLCARDYKDPKCVQVGTFSANEKIITDSEDECLHIKNNTKKGYLEAYEGDGVYTNTSTKRGTVQKDMIQTLTTIQDKGVVVKDKTFIEKHYDNFINKNKYIPEMFNPYNEKEIKEIAPTQTTQCGNTASSATVLKYNGSKVRRLTPRECWRLMSFTDEEFDKASKVNSASQLYKQARKFHCCKYINRNI